MFLHSSNQAFTTTLETILAHILFVRVVLSNNRDIYAHASLYGYYDITLVFVSFFFFLL